MWSKSFALVSDLWNYNLTDLIPKDGETYKLKTMIMSILTYAALLRLTLVVLIYVTPFSALRRTLMRIQYKLFGV